MSYQFEHDCDVAAYQGEREEAESAPLCEYCADRPGTHTAYCEDHCPTDRGDEVRSYDMWLCDECEPMVPNER